MCQMSVYLLILCNQRGMGWVNLLSLDVVVLAGMAVECRVSVAHGGSTGLANCKGGQHQGVHCRAHLSMLIWFLEVRSRSFGFRGKRSVCVCCVCVSVETRWTITDRVS